MRARAYVKGLCRDAGLEVHEDAIGNTFARWEGTEPDLAPIATGSHIDAIPNAGLYDGCVGVLGGLEAIRVLQQLGFKPRRSIELVIFTAEEPTRFGIGCLGSRMMAGVLSPEQAIALRDKEGRGLEELRRSSRIHRLARIGRLALEIASTSSSNCTSSKVRCSSRKASTSASSRTSPHRPACASSSRAKAATPAAS